MIGDLDQLPTARELCHNIIKLPEPVAWRLLGYRRNKQNQWEKKNDGRVAVDGTWVLIDDVKVYNRRP